ncbi:Transposase [Formivibrio citricus]|uniref:Transposase n=1 Tax=Formivibrio citricus TaxID=83765 RepID=A0A1I5AVL2_9NEIS|nr:IS21 family transposase [Formivibrio citricus]SFN66259.1 Transposase [Formivibrio citricus]
MRQIRQVLRLAFNDKVSRRVISASLCLHRDTVRDYLVRAAAAKLSWPLPPDLDDAALEDLLFPPVSQRSIRKPQPDWATVHVELKKKGATLQALHAEYLEEYPDGLAYSRYCDAYRKWAKHLKRYMRQTYIAGEKALVDFAGPTMPIYLPETRKERRAQIFVGVLGASNYTFAEALWSQKLPDWIATHTRMFEFFGGVPAVVVCDNLKAGVSKASRTEPEIHATYQNMAAHYATMIIPARPRKPQDKAKAENGVLVVERWILFRLRKRVFTSLDELNAAIRELLIELNNRPFQKLPGSRRSQYESIDRPALKPLPIQHYEYTEFRKVRVGQDGLFELDGCPYSAPWALCRQEVELRVTAATVEILHRGRRVGSHERSRGSQPVIDPQHLSPEHRYVGFWAPDIELKWAADIGEYARSFLKKVLEQVKRKDLGMRAAGAMKRLEKDYGAERLNTACARALEIDADSMSSVRSILRAGLDKKGAESGIQEAAFDHVNVRGPGYYH